MKTPLIFIVIILQLLGGCSQCSEDSDDKQQETTVSTTPVAGSPRLPSWIRKSQQTRGTFLLTPEQFAQQLKVSLEYEPGWNLPDGRFVNTITDFLAVPLGGVDFTARSERDRQPKVQTQLIIRQVAWEAASSIVWRDVDPDNPDDPKVFLIAHMENPDPTQPAWIEQLNDLYWRLYSRAPTAGERARMQQAYRDTVQQWHEWPPSGWIVVVYAMLASTEMWNL